MNESKFYSFFVRLTENIFLVFHENLNSILTHFNPIENCYINLSKTTHCEKQPGGSAGWSAVPLGQGGGFTPRQGTRKNQPTRAPVSEICCFSPSLSFPLPLSKINEFKNKKKWVFKSLHPLPQPPSSLTTSSLFSVPVSPFCFGSGSYKPVTVMLSTA